MKKTTVLGMVAGALTVLASCSSDLDVAPNNSDGETTTVTFSLSIPQEIQSRTYSDCDYTNRLQYAIYDKTTAEKIQAKVSAAAAVDDADDAGTESVDELKPLVYANIDNGDFSPMDWDYSFDVKLAENKTYYAIFWADNDESPYQFDEKTMSLTIDYSKAEANQDSYDAFTACYEFKVNGSSKHEVVLRRPFAQINFGTDDLDQLTGTGITVTKSAFKVRPYQSLNLFSGEVGDQAEDYMTFDLTQIPATTDEAFPVAGFEYVAMNYILAPVDKETTDFYLLVDDDEYELHCPNIPIQRNYRTNIYGSLFLRPNNFIVSIDSRYYEDDNKKDDLLSYETWDGSVADVVIPDTEGVIHIKYGAQLARLFYKCNRNEQHYADNKIVLESNLDMGGFDWTPIAANGDGSTDEPCFMGEFDGQGHTIKNFRINGEYGFAGVFGMVSDAYIHDLIIEDATVVNSKTDDVCHTGLLLACGRDTDIENITIKGNVSVNGSFYAGTIAGELQDGSLSNITIDVDENSCVTLNNAAGYGYCGGVVGFDNGVDVSDITSNINAVAYSTTAENGNKNVSCIGGFTGGCYEGTVFNSCKISGNVTLYNSIEYDGTPNPFIMTIGGIAGTQYVTTSPSITFNSCSYTGRMVCYHNNKSVSKTVRENNSNWKYCGWLCGSGDPVTNENKVKVN
jgi:hypothetical protein